MNLNLLFLLFGLLSLVAASQECGWVIDPAYPNGINPTGFAGRVPVCYPPRTIFSRFISPIYDLINGFLSRTHQNVEDGDDAAWKKYPWLVTSLPSYANFSISDNDIPGYWSMHSHATLYKRVPRDEKSLNITVDRYLVLASLEEHPQWWSPFHHFETLSANEADQAREITNDVAHITIENAPMVLNLPGMCPRLPQIFHTLTSKSGMVDQWFSLDPACTTGISNLDLFEGIKTANMSIQPYKLPCARHKQSRDSTKVFFVPPRGLTIISDVDDVLRVAEVWNFKQTVLDLFARPYIPWLNMDKVYHNWSRDIPLGGGGYWRNGKWISSPLPTQDLVTNVHFHYVSDTPEPAVGFYMNGTNHFYPAGSWDVRPLDTTSIAAVSNSRIISIKRMLETFPERKFILIGDTTSNHMMRGFPKLMEEFPSQVQCILMRDTQATEPADWVIAAMRHFKKLPDNKYLFFRTPNGHKGTTLSNVSTHHLASLATLASPDRLASHEFPQYVEHLTDGCFPLFPLEDTIAQSKYPDDGICVRFRSVILGIWWKIVCLWVQFFPGHRPDPVCRFDRRPGTKYHNGTVEPEHDQ